LIFNLLIFGIDSLLADSTLDINIHDTYFVIANFYLILILGVLVFFCLYLSRAILEKFKNLTANLILIISTIVLILILNRISTIFENFFFQNSGWTIKPPINSGKGLEQFEHEFESNNNNFGIISSVFFIYKYCY